VFPNCTRVPLHPPPIMARILAEFDTAHSDVIHDAQLDINGHCLATASADGHIRLWDTKDPSKPALITDLAEHSGPVHQVAWAPIESGVLLASASSDGTVRIWGQLATRGKWHSVFRQDLKRYGPVLTLAWAPAQHGTTLACGSAEGRVTVITYSGPQLQVGLVEVEHRWDTTLCIAGQGPVNAISWATPPEFSFKSLGMAGARMVVAGEEGVQPCFWDPSHADDNGVPLVVGEYGVQEFYWNDATDPWHVDKIDIPSELRVCHRDVDWKPWDGSRETIASCTCNAVVIWLFESAETSSSKRGRWQVAQRVPIPREVWKLSWSEIGGTLLLSCGGEEQSALLLKQQLSGTWDFPIDVSGTIPQD